MTISVDTVATFCAVAKVLKMDSSCSADLASRIASIALSLSPASDADGWIRSHAFEIAAREIKSGGRGYGTRGQKLQGVPHEFLRWVMDIPSAEITCA